MHNLSNPVATHAVCASVTGLQCAFGERMQSLLAPEKPASSASLQHHLQRTEVRCRRQRAANLEAASPYQLQDLCGAGRRAKAGPGGPSRRLNLRLLSSIPKNLPRA
eukprot:1281073-Pleurochrysis_carterae.AAC.1